MKSNNYRVSTLIVGFCLLASSLVLLISGSLHDDVRSFWFGISILALSIFLFFVNVCSHIYKYSESRPIKGGQINYRYLALKRKTRDDLQIFLRYDDVETASGIKRDFYNQSKMLGIDKSIYEEDYRNLVERVQSQAR